MRVLTFFTRKRLLAAAGVLILCLGGWPLWLNLSGNFHTVAPGMVYRSAQPDTRTLEDAVARLGIRSVLNLRGASPGVAWYDAERATSAALGLQHADFAMNASRKPTQRDIRDLVALMRSMPKPMLIHCLHGADRTGFASALYLAALTETDVEIAERQLSFAYGHVSIPVLSAAYAMDEGWEDAEADLGFD